MEIARAPKSAIFFRGSHVDVRHEDVIYAIVWVQNYFQNYLVRLPEGVSKGSCFLGGGPKGGLCAGRFRFFV